MLVVLASDTANLMKLQMLHLNPFPPIQPHTCGTNRTILGYIFRGRNHQNKFESKYFSPEIIGGIPFEERHDDVLKFEFLVATFKRNNLGKASCRHHGGNVQY